MKDDKDCDLLPKWLVATSFPFLSLKILMVKQNLQSWFLDMNPSSSQVAGLLNKATFPFQLTLVSPVLAFELWTAEPEFSNILLCESIAFSFLLLSNTPSRDSLWFVYPFTYRRISRFFPVWCDYEKKAAMNIECKVILFYFLWM